VFSSTLKLLGSISLGATFTPTLAPNSDVLPFTWIAVAVIWSAEARPETVSVPEKLPLASAIRNPRNLAPSPKPLGSGALTKISIRALQK
jgi:hypothetical protein